MKISFKSCRRKNVYGKIEIFQFFAIISKPDGVWSTYKRYWATKTSEKVNSATLFERIAICSTCNKGKKCVFGEWMYFRNTVLILFNEG